MKKIAAYLLSTTLALCSFSPGIWARETNELEIGKCVQNKDLHGISATDKDLNQRFKTEIKKGAAIAQRAKQLRATNKGFAKAYAEMLKRGGKPLFEEAGVSLIARDSKRSPFMKVSTAAAQELSDGEYEMTFFPFDTGDDAVWEGTIYAKGPVSEGTFAVSMSTTHTKLSEAVIYYENFYAPDGTELDQAAVPKQEGGSSTKASFVAAGSAGTSKAVVYQRFQAWLNCVNMACYTAMRICIWTGPFYFICFNSSCLWSMLSCLPPIGL